MTQTADKESEELKTTMNAIAKATEANAKATEANAKAIADLTIEMRVGFANVDTRFAKLEGQIDANTKAIEALVKTTEANAKAIADLTIEMKVGFANVEARFANVEARFASIDARFAKVESQIEANTKAIEALGKMTEANAKAIADLTIEMKVGFANVDTKLAKLDVFEERTKGLDRRLDGKELAQRGILTGSIVVVVGGLLLAIAKYLFLGITA
jgi:hypothetical protein